MKKHILFLLFLLIFVSVPINSVMADDNNNDNEEDESVYVDLDNPTAVINVKYVIPEAFSVVIPSTLTSSTGMDRELNFNILVSVNLTDNHKLVITPDDTVEFTLQDDTNIKRNGYVSLNQTEFTGLIKDQQITGNISLIDLYPGVWSGNVIFTVKKENID